MVEWLKSTKSQFFIYFLGMVIYEVFDPLGLIIPRWRLLNPYKRAPTNLEWFRTQDMASKSNLMLLHQLLCGFEITISPYTVKILLKSKYSE